MKTGEKRETQSRNKKLRHLGEILRPELYISLCCMTPGCQWTCCSLVCKIKQPIHLYKVSIPGNNRRFETGFKRRLQQFWEQNVVSLILLSSSLQVRKIMEKKRHKWTNICKWTQWATSYTANHVWDVLFNTFTSLTHGKPLHEEWHHDVCWEHKLRIESATCKSVKVLMIVIRLEVCISSCIIGTIVCWYSKCWGNSKNLNWIVFTLIQFKRFSCLLSTGAHFRGYLSMLMCVLTIRIQPNPTN